MENVTRKKQESTKTFTSLFYAKRRELVVKAFVTYMSALF